MISKEFERTSEAFYFDDFKLQDGKLYYIGKSEPLTKGKGKIRVVGAIMEILGKERLQDLGFDIPVGKVTAQQATTLNRVEEELPSASDVAKADDIELQEIAKSTEDLSHKGKKCYPCMSFRSQTNNSGVLKGTSGRK